MESSIEFAINSELKFWSETLAPALRKALRRTKGINLNSIMARSLHMGDELHNRSIQVLTCLLTPYCRISDRSFG